MTLLLGLLKGRFSCWIQMSRISNIIWVAKRIPLEEEIVRSQKGQRTKGKWDKWRTVKWFRQMGNPPIIYVSLLPNLWRAYFVHSLSLFSSPLLLNEWMMFSSTVWHVIWVGGSHWVRVSFVFVTLSSWWLTNWFLSVRHSLIHVFTEFIYDPKKESSPLFVSGSERHTWSLEQSKFFN